MSCSNAMLLCYCQCESALFRRRGGVPLPYHRPTWISDALVRQSLDCLLGIAPRDAGLGVLSGRNLIARSPYWYASFTRKDGRRLKISTKRTDKAEAWDILNAYVRAEGQIATQSATEAQLRKTINELLVKLGENKLSDPTVQEQLDAWIASKKGAVSDGTLL